MNIIDRVRIDFERLPLSEQAEIRAAAQNYTGAFERLSPTDKQKVLQRAQALVRRKARAVYGVREDQLPDFDYEILEYEVPALGELPDLDELPELAKPPRKETRWWRPSAENAKPGPQAEPKPSRKGERKPSVASRQWKAGK